MVVSPVPNPRIRWWWLHAGLGDDAVQCILGKATLDRVRGCFVQCDIDCIDAVPPQTRRPTHGQPLGHVHYITTVIRGSTGLKCMGCSVILYLPPTLRLATYWRMASGVAGLDTSLQHRHIAGVIPRPCLCSSSCHFHMQISYFDTFMPAVASSLP